MLQNLDKLREMALGWFAKEQVHMLRHRDITHEERSGAVTHFSQNLHDGIASAHGGEKRTTLVATEGDEVEVSASVMAFEFPRYEEEPTLSKSERAPSLDES